MLKTRFKKKGQATSNAVNNIILLITGIGVAVLVMIFVGSLGGQTFELVEDDIDSIANNVIANESFTPLNATAVSLAHGDMQTGTVSIYNQTDDAIGLGNFTIDYENSTLTLLTNHSNGTAMGIDYTWGEVAVRDSIKDSIVSGFEALETTGSYMPIIVLAVVISLVLALVLGFTMLKGKGGSNNTAL